MICHLRALLASTLILLGASYTFATTTFTSITGATAQNAATPTTFYYSNITTSTFTDATTSVVYYVGNSADGGACSPTVNPNCLKSTNQMTITGSTTQTSGSLYLLVLQNAPSAGDAIDPNTEVVGPISSTSATFTPTFDQICNAYYMATGANTSGLANSQYLDQHCYDEGPIQATPVDPAPKTVNLYLVNDFGNAGTVTESATFQLIFDSSIQSVAIPSASGFDPFSMFPGDKKAYITNVTEQTGFPTSINDNVGANSVRFYYTTGPTYDATTAATYFAQAVPGAAFYDDAVDASGNLSTQYVEGLTNTLTYYFRAAVVDLAGNIGYLTSGDDSQARVVTPDAVVGLLAENSSCFIATAAFGANMEPEVKILRQFRDQVLMKTAQGQKFVSWYYRHSPKWAYRIQNSPNARFAVRTALYPVVGLSYLSLKFGAKNACMLFATLLLFPFLFVRWRQSLKTLNAASASDS